jgi:hypothetical protein
MRSFDIMGGDQMAKFKHAKDAILEIYAHVRGRIDVINRNSRCALVKK